MTEQATELRRAYRRQWAKNNPEKVKEQQARYWEKRAAQEAAKAQPPEDEPKE